MTRFKVKDKTCAYSLCGLKFTPKRMGQKTCENAESGYECARGYAKELAEKKEKEEKDLLIKAYRENNKTLADYKEELQYDYINVIVRLIDKGHPCLSSKASAGTYTVHAGHIKPVGGYENIRFNLLVIFGQADFDNTYGGGNYSKFREGIEQTFGKALMEEIDGLDLKYPKMSFRKVDIVEAKLVCSKIIKELEAENRIYTNEERIELRRKFNERIGLYK